MLCSVRADLLYQFTIDLLDFWIPATNLGLVNLNDGVVGIFGYVGVFTSLFRADTGDRLLSSILGARQQWLSVNGRK